MDHKFTLLPKYYHGWNRYATLTGTLKQLLNIGQLAIFSRPSLHKSFSVLRMVDFQFENKPLFI